MSPGIAAIRSRRLVDSFRFQLLVDFLKYAPCCCKLWFMSNSCSVKYTSNPNFISLIIIDRQHFKHTLTPIPTFQIFSGYPWLLGHVSTSSIQRNLPITFVSCIQLDSYCTWRSDYFPPITPDYQPSPFIVFKEKAFERVCVCVWFECVVSRALSPQLSSSLKWK